MRVVNLLEIALPVAVSGCFPDADERTVISPLMHVARFLLPAPAGSQRVQDATDAGEQPRDRCHRAAPDHAEELREGRREFELVYLLDRLAQWRDHHMRGLDEQVRLRQQ